MKVLCEGYCPFGSDERLPHSHDVDPAVPTLPGKFGDPGVRDPESPCDAYRPGKPEARADCHTDGHYMCRTDPGCVRYKAPPPPGPPDCLADCRLPCPDGVSREDSP